ncbi:hypothetical protein SteCoe_13299 [Stentor coeruleus]|uniref:RBR-type E3 ubiquitin transferase n=1 Tax=Stentor coeruleus TaxID=5963 RepID=A0A1R2C4M9_9CILI|nr:hypothetical protein SteCoe_15011 [Stentor coeruleus]OMJ85389.1 hypothetical protein SteCoe_13299 [Stentor coeruleus]
MPLFLQKYYELLQIKGMQVKVALRPKGKKCLHCGRYITEKGLMNAIPLWCNPTEHFMCSAECLQRQALVCTNYSLMDLNYVTCPMCRTTIHPEQIKESFGNRFEMIQQDACDRALKNLLDEDSKKQLEPKFTCQICIVDYAMSLAITLECDHRFCGACMKMYITGLIESAQVSEQNMKCPSCIQAMTLAEIEDLAGPELYEKYQKFLLRGIKINEEDDPNMYIFNCPGVDCEFFCFADKDLEEIECPKCYWQCCPKCYDKSHKGQTCEAYAEYMKSIGKGDENFEKLIMMEGIVKCPSCGAAVERISGCEFMVCTSSKCQGRTYFCYECGIKLPEDHAPHNCVKKNLRIGPIPNRNRMRPMRRAPAKIGNRGQARNVIRVIAKRGKK